MINKPKNIVWMMAISIIMTYSTNLFGQTKNRIVDIRDELLESAKTSDKDFPNGKDVLLTHFSYVGKLQTKEGVIYVADLKSVLTNMSAPRGINHILFFNSKYKYLGKQNYAASTPLWCEKGKLYLFGDIDGIDNSGQGNVIDLADGFKHLKIYHETRYGSSGGIF